MESKIEYSFEQLKGAGPVARFDHVLLKASQTVFLFAGVGENWSNLNDTWTYDENSKTWSNFPTIAPNSDPLPPFKDHSAIFDPTRNQIYIFGGKVQNIPSNDFWILDLSSKKWTHKRGDSNSPIPRYAHSAVIHGRSMYLFGGADANATVLGDLWAYNLDTDTWRQIQAAGPQKRDYHTANVHNKSMYVFGGFSGLGPTNDLWAFNFDTESWKLITSKAPVKPRSGHASVDKDGKIFFFGGEMVYEDKPVYFNGEDLWSWNPETNEWTEHSTGQTRPKGRLGTRMVLLGDNKVLMYGGLALAETVDWEAKEWFGDSWLWM